MPGTQLRVHNMCFMKQQHPPREGSSVIIVDAPTSERPPDAPASGPSSQHPAVARTLDRVLSVQRPVVLAHLKRIRAKHPEASPAELIHMLERHYLAVVMAGGAGVGAAAAIPGVGTAAALALSGAETIGFIEATALFAHSVAEVHGIVLEDRDRTHALILALMLGEEGASLLRQVTGQVVGGLGRGAFWSDIVMKSMPKQLVTPALDKLRSMFLKKLTKTGTASVLGKAIPYGVGAVIGGTGNRLLGRRVIRSAQIAFGPAPIRYPAHLTEILPKPQKPIKPSKPSKTSRAIDAPTEASRRRLRLGKRR